MEVVEAVEAEAVEAAGVVLAYQVCLATNS